MTHLSAETCYPCRKGDSTLDGKTLEVCLEQLPDWRVVNRDSVRLLEKCYAVKPYTAALIFVQAIGKLAELENHHPEILLEWGRVTVRWWTHTIQGVHKNDCILAARCDVLYSTTFTSGQHHCPHDSRRGPE